MEEVNLTTIKPKNSVLLLAQEISFAKVLACNDKRMRDRGIKRLKKWFMARSQGSIEFTRDDLMRIWKGLFYCMWMSDKPLIQEELSEEISNLVHSFKSMEASLLFVETFFSSLSIEWFGIDQLRLDKFMMLVRRFIRQSLELLARRGWQTEHVEQMALVYQRTLTSAPLGLSMHITDVFCEELAKVGKGELSTATIYLFISVFARVMANLKDGRFISQITRCVFLHLIRQTDVGIEHQMKEAAWKEHGFPGGDVDTAEKIEMSSDSEEEEVMSEDGEKEEEREVGVDARAGKVDVLLPPLDFDARDLLKLLRELRNMKDTTTKARKTLIQLITKFDKLVAGKYPLGLHKVNLPEKINNRKVLKEAARRLQKTEQEIIHGGNDSGEEIEQREEEIEQATAGKRKRKGVQHTKTVWEVSDSDMSGNHSEFESNTSWKISEATDQSHNKSKKRKLEDSLTTETKNIQGSLFCVSESKENSTLPITSTPITTKSTGRKNILKKASLNSENKKIGSEHNIINKDNPTLKRKRNGKRNQRLKIENCLPANESEKVQNVNGYNTDTSHLQINTSTADKNNGWGGDWDQPLQNGEYEIFIPNKKYVEKRKSLGLPYPVSSITHKSEDAVTPVNKIKKFLKNKSATPGSQKKVEFNLSANKSQDYKEYARKLKRRKSDIPFDASRKPVQGLLKNSTPSPINPFYKKKLKI